MFLECEQLRKFKAPRVSVARADEVVTTGCDKPRLSRQELSHRGWSRSFAPHAVKEQSGHEGLANMLHAIKVLPCLHVTQLIYFLFFGQVFAPNPQSQTLRVHG